MMTMMGKTVANTKLKYISFSENSSQRMSVSAQTGKHVNGIAPRFLLQDADSLLKAECKLDRGPEGACMGGVPSVHDIFAACEDIRRLIKPPDQRFERRRPRLPTRPWPVHRRLFSMVFCAVHWSRFWFRIACVLDFPG